MNITIVNIHVTKPQGYLYIGRDSHDAAHHYGNPFTHLWGHTQATVKVASREEAVTAYEDWLRGDKWHGVEQSRRLWILERIKHLAWTGNDITLGCFCAPKSCHGEVLAKLIQEAREVNRVS